MELELQQWRVQIYLRSSGVLSKNIIMIDRKGVIYTADRDNLNQWKSAHAIETKHKNS